MIFGQKIRLQNSTWCNKISYIYICVYVYICIHMYVHQTFILKSYSQSYPHFPQQQKKEAASFPASRSFFSKVEVFLNLIKIT